MKKSILTLLAVIIISSVSFAQGGFRIGARGGINNTWLYNGNLINDDTIKHELTASGFGGLALGYDATFYNFGIYVDVFFKQIGQKYAEDKPSPRWSRHTKLNYIAIPVTLRLRSAGDTYKKTFTYGGAYFEIGVEPAFISSVSVKSKTSDTAMTFPNITSDYFENFALSAIIGFGFHQIGTEQWSVTHGLRFGYGILDVISSTGGSGKTYTNSRGVESAYKKTHALFGGYMLTIQYRFQRGGKH